MIVTTIEDRPVAKKKTGPSKNYGTLIRVSHEFAAALRQAASFEKVSMADYVTTHLLPIVEKKYREAILREARRMEGKG